MRPSTSFSITNKPDTSSTRQKPDTGSGFSPDKPRHHTRFTHSRVACQACRGQINVGCHVVVREGLSVGDHTLFGEGVSIHDDNHVAGRGPEPIASRGFEARPITIGANVWVGAKAVILLGVRIGDNAVVGAGAVVTRDVPACTVVAGVPARIIREI